MRAAHCDDTLSGPACQECNPPLYLRDDFPRCYLCGYASGLKAIRDGKDTHYVCQHGCP